MKLFWCCVALLTPSVFAGVDVEKTVKQVQTILQANAQLPRLSRDEILQLLNDIRAEDAKSKSSSTQNFRESKEITTTPFNIKDNEIDAKNFQDNLESDDKHAVFVTASTAQAKVETTTLKEPSVMVVLPYTPRDGASLQELYTRPPRVEVLPESKVTPRPFKKEKIQDTLKNNAKVANKQKLDIPAELQAFLDSHGLKGKPLQDSFLLPLDGFKPLPPAKVVDGTVQLPENILLTYDLITPTETKLDSDNIGAHSAAHSYLYEPLRPKLPFELDTSSSEFDKTVLPLEIPKKGNSKSATAKPSFTPIDYDSIMVIPLNSGPNPLEDEKATLETDQSKRQANSTDNNTAGEVKEDEKATLETDQSKRQANSTDNTTAGEVKVETTTNPSNETEDTATTPADDSAAENSDTGASITDLEESFGGVAPEMPGDSELPPPRKNGFYWMLDWNSFLEVGDGDTKVNIRFEPKLGDRQMFLPVTVP